MKRAIQVIIAFAAAIHSLHAQETHWYKGNTHTHSFWSDGNDFPEMITDWYRNHGYQFLGMSDHNLLARGDKWQTEEYIEKKKGVLGKKVLDKYVDRFGKDWVETRANVDGKLEVRLKTLEEYRKLFEKPGEFVLVEAEEISASMGKHPVHICAVNLADPIKPIKDLTSIREVMRQNLQLVAEQAQKTGRPMFAHINHPNFQWAITAEDLAHVIEDRYFEVFNGHASTFPYGDSKRATSHLEKVWDVANTIRLADLKAPILYGVATDDSHHYHGGDVAIPGRGWIMVRSAKLEPNALVEAVQRGDFYASTGVELEDVKFDPASRKLSIRIKKEPGVKYVTEFRGTPKEYDHAVREAPADPKDASPVRLEYSDDVGKLLATSTSTEPEYQMTGTELYVRAMIRSDKPTTYPHPQCGDHPTQQAWTQPVGFE